jgi:hypothetical protein
MHSSWLLGAALAGVVLGAGTASAAPSETYPLSQVRRGQKGYGVTTINGTKPERFNFEIIGVNKNFLPKMDIVLVKSDDPKLKVTGFWQGMSGSPLYLEGKLLCAFSYGFRFNKVAIGGCTPIEYMKREGFKPRRAAGHSVARASAGGAARAPLTRASWREWRQLTPTGNVQQAMARLGEPREPWILRAPLPRPPARAKATGVDDRGMVASSVPLAMSGFSAPAFAEAKQLLASYPLEPMQAGGTGHSNQGPTAFQPGGAISVQLMRGDMSIAGTGTVSYVDDNKVLAFGHPMFQMGETYAPVSTAEIHTVIPSAFSAFIVASPMRELGSLTQDRQSTIAADTKLKTSMIPMRITIAAGNNGSRERATFDVEMLHNKFFTSTLAAIAASSAASFYLPDRDHVTAKIDSRVKIKGHPPLKFTDYVYSNSGAAELIGGARGLRVLVPLLLNPFAPLEVTGVELDVSLSFDTNFGEIDAVRLPVAELTPGTRSYVDVDMLRYDGKNVTERIPFDVPESVAGSLVQIAVTAGDAAKLDAAPPRSVDDLLRIFSKMLPGNVFAVTLYSASEGAAMNGRLIRDMPASALDKLKTTTSTDVAASYRAITQSTKRSPRVITGGQSILVKVKDLKN